MSAAHGETCLLYLIVPGEGPRIHWLFVALIAAFVFHRIAAGSWWSERHQRPVVKTIKVCENFLIKTHALLYCISMVMQYFPYQLSFTSQSLGGDEPHENSAFAVPCSAHTIRQKSRSREYSYKPWCVFHRFSSLASCKEKRAFLKSYGGKLGGR